MDQNTKNKLLQIKALVDECLGEIDLTTAGSHKKVNQPKSDDVQTLASHILLLRTEGFFKKPKTSNDVYEKIKDTYPCEKKRVGVELIRLQNKKELRKITETMGSTKRVAYVS